MIKGKKAAIKLKKYKVMKGLVLNKDKNMLQI